MIADFTRIDNTYIKFNSESVLSSKQQLRVFTSYSHFALIHQIYLHYYHFPIALEQFIRRKDSQLWVEQNNQNRMKKTRSKNMKIRLKYLGNMGDHLFYSIFTIEKYLDLNRLIAKQMVENHKSIEQGQLISIKIFNNLYFFKIEGILNHELGVEYHNL